MAATEPLAHSAERAAVAPVEDVGGLAALALALILGLGGAAFIPFFAHFYEVTVKHMPWLGQEVVVHALPPVVFFLFFLLLLTANPLLRGIKVLASSVLGFQCGDGLLRLQLRRRELMVILSMWLLATAVGYSCLAMSGLHAAGEAANYATEEGKPAVKADYYSYLKPELFLSPEESRKYHLGLRDDDARVSPREIPWHVWIRPLAFWLPLMLVVIVLSSSLVQIVHRQWAQNELLSYPIAEFAGSLLEQREARPLPALFYNLTFWSGFVVAAFIYLLHGLNAWFPLMVKIPLYYQHLDLLREFEFLSRYCGREAYSLFRSPFYLYVIALTVLLPTDVSLTSWLGYVLMIFGVGVYFLFTGEVIGHVQTQDMRCGMHVGMLLILIVVGRREYATILRHAVTFRRTNDPALRNAAIACRVFALAFVLLTAFMVYAGVHVVVAILLCCSLSLIIVLIARMTAEMGLPWLVEFWGMSRRLPLRMFGLAAIGPKSVAVMTVLAAVMDVNTTNTVAAQETTYRRLEDGQRRGLSRWKFNLLLLATACVILGVTVFTSLWDNYSYGARWERYIADCIRPGMNNTATDLTLMELEGTLADVKQASLTRRLGLMQPAKGFWRFAVCGVVVLGACAFMRLRFAWWPFHPLPLLLIDTWCLSRLYGSLFVCWVIKVGMLKIGGGAFFTRAKPFFFGIIMGQVVVGGIWVVTGTIYYLVTDTVPPQAGFFL